MYTKTCHCGKVSRPYTSSNLEEIIINTGFVCVFLDSGETKWFCPDCARRITEHVNAIIDISGDDENWMNWRSIVRMGTILEKYKDHLAFRKGFI